MRDALLLNGLSSPRESDVQILLKRHDREGLQFDRGALAIELENLVRQQLYAKAADYDRAAAAPPSPKQPWSVLL